jgi:hypothetical protein
MVMVRSKSVERRKAKCIVCGHIIDALLVDWLKWAKEGPFTSIICGQCIKVYRPDLVWLWMESGNIERFKPERDSYARDYN